LSLLGFGDGVKDGLGRNGRNGEREREEAKYQDGPCCLSIYFLLELFVNLVFFLIT
jgi:hypothetical protein